jgi:hypothetical protein
VDEGVPVEGESVDQRGAERLLERRSTALLREPDLRKRRAKAYALLARNGFDPDICRDVARQFVERVQQSER